MSADDAAVADLLAKARAAHLAYRRALKPSDRQDAMRRAFNFRIQAETLDPGLTADIWRHEPEKFQHDAVMAFYRQQLEIVNDVEVDREDKATRLAETFRPAARRILRLARDNKIDEDRVVADVKRLLLSGIADGDNGNG